MDHAANDVLLPVALYSENHYVQRFLELLTASKGRTSSISAPPPAYLTFHTVLVDRGLPVTGLYNCVHYLEERYPEPSLFFDTPERRAVARMSLDCILDQFYKPQDQVDADELTHLLKTVSTQPFLAGPKLSILDLAFAAACPPLPAFQPYLARVHRTIGLP